MWGGVHVAQMQFHKLPVMHIDSLERTLSVTTPHSERCLSIATLIFALRDGERLNLEIVDMRS